MVIAVDQFSARACSLLLMSCLGAKAIYLEICQRENKLKRKIIHERKPHEVGMSRGPDLTALL